MVPTPALQQGAGKVTHGREEDTGILTPSWLHPRLLHPKGHLRVLVAQQDVCDTRRGVAGGVEVLAAIAQVCVLLTFQTLPTFCKDQEATQQLWFSSPRCCPPALPLGSPRAHPRCPCPAAAGWPSATTG